MNLENGGYEEDVVALDDDGHYGSFGVDTWRQNYI